MICYKPATGKGSNYQREIHYIHYKCENDKVKREDSVLDDKDKGWKSLGSSTIYAGGTGANGAKCEFSAASPIDAKHRDRGYEDDAPSFHSDVAWEIPSVKVRLKLTRTGAFSGLTVVSYGPDGLPNGDSDSEDADDIIVK